MTNPNPNNSLVHLETASFQTISKFLHNPQNQNGATFDLLAKLLIKRIYDTSELSSSSPFKQAYQSNNYWLTGRLLYISRQKFILPETLMTIIDHVEALVSLHNTTHFYQLFKILRENQFSSSNLDYLIQNLFQSTKDLEAYRGIALDALCTKQKLNQNQITKILKIAAIADKHQIYHLYCYHLAKNPNIILNQKTMRLFLQHENSRIRYYALQRSEAKNLDLAFIAKMYQEEKSSFKSKQALGEILEQTTYGQKLTKSLNFIRLNRDQKVVKRTSTKIRKKIAQKVLETSSSVQMDTKSL